MPVTPSSYASLHRLLMRDMNVAAIAESLVSLDATTDRNEFRRVADERSFDVVGARAEGVMMGYVEPGVSDDVQFIADDQVIDAEAPLHDAVRALDAHARVFVSTLGAVSGIVTRDDLEKAPGRMWLFGMITLIETALRRVVASRYPDDAWTDVLSATRVGLATQLRDERARRGEDVALLDCVQFHDLANLAARQEDVRRTFGHSSRREAEQRMKEWAKLRNNLAHSQGFVHDSWALLARVSHNAGNGGLARLLDMM